MSQLGFNQVELLPTSGESDGSHKERCFLPGTLVDVLLLSKCQYPGEE